MAIPLAESGRTFNREQQIEINKRELRDFGFGVNRAPQDLIQEYVNGIILLERMPDAIPTQKYRQFVRTVIRMGAEPLRAGIHARTFFVGLNNAKY